MKLLHVTNTAKILEMRWRRKMSKYYTYSKCKSSGEQWIYIMWQRMRKDKGFLEISWKEPTIILRKHIANSVSQQGNENNQKKHRIVMLAKEEIWTCIICWQGQGNIYIYRYTWWVIKQGVCEVHCTCYSIKSK